MLRTGGGLCGGPQSGLESLLSTASSCWRVCFCRVNRTDCAALTRNTETNYDRITAHAAAQPSSGVSTPPDPESEAIHGEKSAQQTTIATSTDFEAGVTSYPRKSYLQKLSLTGDKPRPNRMLEVFIAPFKGVRKVKA